MTENEYVIDNPYAPPAKENQVYLEPDRGGSLMKMGIVGAVFLGFFPIVSIILGAIGWSRAAHDLRMMEDGRMSMEHGARPKTKAGLILAKINTIVGPFAIISLILYIWLEVETMSYY
jgi:hypothetical protein